MADMEPARAGAPQLQNAHARRFKLRLLLLSAADAARHGRRVTALANRTARPLGRAIRERVSTLLRAS